MSATTALSKFVAKLREPDGRIALRWKLVAVGVLALLLFAIMSGLFWSIVAFAGFAAVIVGVFAMATGSASKLRIRSRAAGAIVLAVGLIVGVIGSGANAAISPRAEMSATSTQQNAERSERALTSTSTPTPTPTPVVTESDEMVTEVIPYSATTVEDGNLDVGTSSISVGGQNGEKTTTYRVTYSDGVEISREVSGEETTLQPVAEVTSIGVRQPPPPPPAPEPASDCNSNYADVCVPNASDVDCAGGSGNGPAYVSGPLRVVGSDPYDLDRDGDGIACD